MANLKKRPPASAPLGKAYIHGGTLIVITLAGMMLAPLAHDIYRHVKHWLLRKEGDQQQPREILWY